MLTFLLSMLKESLQFLTGFAFQFFPLRQQCSLVILLKKVLIHGVLSTIAIHHAKAAQQNSKVSSACCGWAHLLVCCYCLGMANSQAVSWAHFHIALMSRVNPMSLGFSRPLISRCFIMATNSLLLSSPFPNARRKQ